MRDIGRYFKAHPWITAELILATLFANLLALASPLFVMQVLNRYVAYGVDATLITLTSGVVTAILLELGFRQARHLLAASLTGDEPQRKAIGAFGLLATIKREALDGLNAGERMEALRAADATEAAHGPTPLTVFLDAPFTFLFILAIALLNAWLGLIVLAFAGAVFLLGLWSQRKLERPQKDHSQVSAQGHALATAVIAAPDTIRAFGGHAALMPAWRENVGLKRFLKRLIGDHQISVQTLTQSVTALLGVTVIAFGAVLAVRGDLNVGALMGINILAARALAPLTRLASVRQSLAAAKQAMERLGALTVLPMEDDGSEPPHDYTGALTLKDVRYTPADAASPLFEGLTLTLNAGAVLMVTGRNGAGKTTLMRMLAGLVSPERGQVLVDGIDLRQVSSPWWYRQLIYMPQEPTFLPGSLMSNLKAVDPSIDAAKALALVDAVGLTSFIKEHPAGLEMSMGDAGGQLALGIRRRLALARALAVNGRLVILDEPTEGLDRDGCNAVFAVLKRLSQEGRTIVIVTGNPTLLSGARQILDMDDKPTPAVKVVPQTPTAAPASPPPPASDAPAPAKATTPRKRAPAVKKAPAKKTTTRTRKPTGRGDA